MSWQRLLYGTVVAAGLATTGSLVWFSARQQVKAVDIIQVVQGGQERCLATKFVASTNGVAVYTNRTLVFGAPDPSGAFWVTLDTNDVATTNFYMTVTATNNVVFSRTQETAQAYTYAGLFRVAPVDALKIYRTASTDTKYIWGGYSNYVVAGISDASFNGTYRLVGRTRTATTFKDEYWLDGSAGTRKLIDYGPRGGHLIDFSYDGFDPSSFAWASAVLADDYGEVYFFTFMDECVRFAKWQNVDEFWYGDASAMTVTASDLLPGYLRDAWAFTDDWVWNGIDWTIARAFISSETENIGYGDIQGQALSTKLRAAANWYVDDTAATSGEFLNFSNSLPVLAVPMETYGLPGLSNLWARLALTNFFDYVDQNDYSTNRYYLFGNETGAQVTAFVSVQTPSWVVNSVDLGERYKLAETLRWTRGNGTWKRAWANTPNTVIWASPGWYTTWAEAIAACRSNRFSATYTDGVPYVWTAGIKDLDGTYRAVAYCRAAVLVADGLTTQIQHSVDFYARGQARGSVSYTNSTWSNEGFTLTENCFTRFGQVAAGSYACVTSTIIGQTNIPATFCDEPTTNASTSRGFAVTSGDTVAKWGFQYCTNALP